MSSVRNMTFWFLCAAILLVITAGLVTVAHAADGDIDIPIGDLVRPTNPTEPSNPDVIDSGTWDELTWVLYQNGLLQVTGTGAMPDQQAPWYDNRGLIKVVQIGEGVTSAGAQAFYNCSRMERAELPKSLETIGYGAFAGCSQLKNVSIPATVTSIGAAAFGACGSLETIQIPGGITVIEQRTFAQCSNLTSVTITKNIRTIGTGAFAGCGALKDVYYYGSETQWEEIAVAGENTALLHAVLYCNANEVLHGDVNGDHKVTDADAMYLLRYTLFPDRFPINQSGDMNGDGEETDADAMYLLRYTLFPERFPLK